MFAPKIDKVSSLTSAIELTKPPAPQLPDKGFGDMLKDVMQEANSLQINAAQLEDKFLLGEVQDIHTVMVAAEEAAVAFNLVMEIRNKLLESYQTLMRMPI